MKTIVASLIVTSAFACAQTCVTELQNASGVAQIFSSATMQTWQRSQVLIPAATFGNVPLVITDISVLARAGWRRVQFGELRILLGYSNNATLSSSFASNPAGPLQEVLHVQNHLWTEGTPYGPTPDWTAFGLQHTFTFVPGHGNLLIEFVALGAQEVDGVSYSNLHPSQTSTFIKAESLMLPTVATSSSSGPQFRFCVDHPEVSLLGRPCGGSLGSTPLLGVVGSPVLGAQPVVWLSDAPALSPALLAFGFDNAPPFPTDLTPLGASGCLQYFSLAFARLLLANSAGIASESFAVPTAASTVGAILFSQFFVLDLPGNPLGLTSSNYARFLVGM